MKKLLLLSAALVALLSCGNVGKKATIETLKNDWQATTEKVQSFSNDLQAGFMHCKSVQDTMGLPPGSLQKLDNATKAEVQALLKNVEEYRNSYIDMGREFNEFFKLWEQKTQRFDEIATIVKYDQKTDKDIPSEIASLQAEVADANTKLQKWNADLQALNSKVATNFEQFKQKAAAIR